MTNKQERDQATTMERQVFDAFAAISYCLGMGTVGSVACRTGVEGSLVSLLPQKPHENPGGVEHFQGATLLEAFVEAGRRCDHAIHTMAQEGADVQAYFHSKDALQKLRNKPLIVTPGSN